MCTTVIKKNLKVQCCIIIFPYKGSVEAEYGLLTNSTYSSGKHFSKTFRCRRYLENSCLETCLQSTPTEDLPKEGSFV